MSLDSLLDTVTNVVGFLVIVLAVAQLNLTLVQPEPGPEPPTPGEAVRRIERMGRELEAKENQSQELGKEIEAAEPDVRMSMKLAAQETSLQKAVRILRDEVRLLRERAKAAEGRLADLNAKIAELAENPPPPPESLRLAKVRVFEVLDPRAGVRRPAWARKDRMTIVCQGGRVLPLDGQRLWNGLTREIRRCLGGSSINLAALSPDALDKLIAHVNAQSVQDEYFRLRLGKRSLGRHTLPVLEFVPRSDRPPDRTADLKDPNGHYLKFLKTKWDPRKHWIRFYVYADSFAAYLAARPPADRTFDVGWVPVKMDFELKQVLGVSGMADAEGPG